ncbi:MAG: hypothetical protein ACR2OU_17915 [Thermomicrobiales bacterium]
MADWSDFFVAQAGASAALTGLIFVGISISLSELIKFPHLLLRAAASLVLLLSVFVTSSLLLAPKQSIHTAGLEVLAVGVISLLITTSLGVSGIRKAEAEYRRFASISVIMILFTTIPFVIAGIVMLTSGDNGLYWLLPAFVFAFVVALVDGWILLVETHR